MTFARGCWLAQVALVTLLLCACTESTERTDVEARDISNLYWVTSDRLNRHTCPSDDCGIVGQFFFRDGTEILEETGDWARVSRYYDAACIDGESDFVDSGNRECSPDNGIVNGDFAEWVELSFLSAERPRDPAERATDMESLVSGSDDFSQYRHVFYEAATNLIASGQCQESDFRRNSGFIKSMLQRDEPIYFTYCGELTISNRIYLNAETGEIFR